MTGFRTVLALGLLIAPPLTAQAPTSPELKFEVASLKPAAPGGRGGGVRPAPGGERYVATNATLKLLLTVAYRIKGDLISGGPAWINSDAYDMNAKAEKPSSAAALRVMLQNLLTERFQLRVHWEKKDLPVYALVADKDGAKMTVHEGAAENPGETWIDVEGDPHPGEFLRNTWHAKATTMEYFAFRLGLMLDRPVLDLTQLKGTYDFDLSFTREPPPGIKEGSLINGAPIDFSGPTIFEAIRKLGLRLDRQKGPVNTMVIDSAEKPAPKSQ